MPVLLPPKLAQKSNPLRLLRKQLEGGFTKHVAHMYIRCILGSRFLCSSKFQVLKFFDSFFGLGRQHKQFVGIWNFIRKRKPSRLPFEPVHRHRTEPVFEFSAPQIKGGTYQVRQVLTYPTYLGLLSNTNSECVAQESYILLQSVQFWKLADVSWPPFPVRILSVCGLGAKGQNAPMPYG
ncbi:Hypothetical_protein [Hexamita inflata]|uniref:Hypothetical_protein n=1 Tax=Hexamita inflata TaxID=28002 RepID=A0AA86PLP3_9EUKA|nr:Hypothetical protein HINF_LOCUS29764 [Hexamita inflata]